MIRKLLRLGDVGGGGGLVSFAGMIALFIDGQMVSLSLSFSLFLLSKLQLHIFRLHLAASTDAFLLR